MVEVQRNVRRSSRIANRREKNNEHMQLDQQHQVEIENKENENIELDDRCKRKWWSREPGE